jgi:hypothetical protein
MTYFAGPGKLFTNSIVKSGNDFWDRSGFQPVFSDAFALDLFRSTRQTRRMKTPSLLLTGLVLIGFLHSTGAAPPSGPVRTVTDLNLISTQALQRSISPKFYKSLLISPIEGWVVVRGNLAGAHLSGMRVVHSELDHRFDALALQLAKEIQMAGYFSIEHPHFGPPVLLHLLIYEIADGTMVLSFPQFIEPGGNQMQYFGCARLAVIKKDGQQVEIKGPESLEGKGWAVRQGQKNWIGAFFKSEMKTPGGVGW